MLIELSPSVQLRLKELAKREENGTITTVLRRAVALYELVMDSHDAGGELIVRDVAGEEIVVPLKGNPVEHLASLLRNI
jgi:hypothetical protein